MYENLDIPIIMCNKEMLTSLVMVTVVFGIFIISASIRIRNAWKTLNNKDSSIKGKKAYRKLDLLFSIVFLLASISFYCVFLYNVGH
jgi:hypothetical protein